MLERDICFYITLFLPNFLTHAVGVVVVVFVLVVVV